MDMMHVGMNLGDSWDEFWRLREVSETWRFHQPIDAAVSTVRVTQEHRKWELEGVSEVI